LHEKPALTFLKVYDKSTETPRSLLEFFNTDEPCVPAYIAQLLDEGLSPIEAVSKALLDLSPPDVLLTASQIEALLSKCDFDDPEKSAFCLLRTHPLPDGNKRSAFLMFLAKSRRIRTCSEFKQVLENWMSEY